jgi:hypothetical protein
MFEQALRERFRFKVDQGTLTTEDLWQLTLPSLDSIAIGLDKELQDQGKSFIRDVTPANAKTALKLDIVKHVIKYKLDEQEARKVKVEKAKQRQKLLEALADKEDAELSNMSKDDLLKALTELDA